MLPLIQFNLRQTYINLYHTHIPIQPNILFHINQSHTRIQNVIMISMLLVNNVVLRFIQPIQDLSSTVLRIKSYLYMKCRNRLTESYAYYILSTIYGRQNMSNYFSGIILQNILEEMMKEIQQLCFFSSLPCVNACVFTPHYS